MELPRFKEAKLIQNMKGVNIYVLAVSSDIDSEHAAPSPTHRTSSIYYYSGTSSLHC
jgi:hypothetical protein